MIYATSVDNWPSAFVTAVGLVCIAFMVVFTISVLFDNRDKEDK